MKRILLLLCGIMLVPVIACSQHLVEVGKGYSCTSVNTTVFRNNSLVTHGDEQYISYYDNDGYLVLGKRKLDSEQWTLHRTQYQGNVKDAHNIISMMIDGEGYMHVSFDHHGHPLNYCRTLKNDGCFIYGFAPAFEMEAFLSDRLVFLFNVRQRIFFGSSVGNFHTVAAVGVKYIFN